MPKETLHRRLVCLRLVHWDIALILLGPEHHGSGHISIELFAVPGMVCLSRSFSDKDTSQRTSHAFSATRLSGTSARPDIWISHDFRTTENPAG